MTFQPNQILDNRYELIEKLGEGGMGVVWKARHKSMGDEVVIKMPLLNDPEILKRFGKEARIMRKHALECPQILNIEDVGDLDGVPWYAMRYLPGGSLGDRTLERDSGGRAKWDDNTFDWLPKIASALDYLHDKNTYHRDVKPENILFSKNGTPYLVDFGIVKTANETTSMMTDQGKAVGTMAYMAPEILDGQKFTPQGDQYSLAVALYETLSGDRPFSGTTFFALFKSIQKGHRKLSELYPAIPAAASSAVDRALSLEPSDRFESCQAFTNAFLTGLTSTTKPSEARTGMVSTPIKPGQGNIVGGQQVPPDEVAVVGHGSTSSGQGTAGGGVFGGIPQGSNSQPGKQKSTLPLVIGASVLGLVLLGGAGLVFSGAFSGSTSSDSPTSSTDAITPASFRLAEDLFSGTGGESTDRNRAVSMFKELARDGSLKSQKRLGQIYSKGELGDEDFAEAFHWFLLAAKQGDAESQMAVGASYSTGQRGVDRDLTQAIKWLQKSADQDFGQAQMMLGVHYFRGLGVKQDNDLAKLWLRKARAADVDGADEILDQVAASEKPKVVELTFQEYKKSPLLLVQEHAELGLSGAETELGYRASKAGDYKTAIEWYRKAIKKNNPRALTNLGVNYQHGRGVKQDYAESARLFKAANEADPNYANAQYNLGVIYAKGYGVKTDAKEAVRWYRSAAEQGEANAQHNLGLMYDNGEGVKEDDTEAVLWYRKAAAQNYANAQTSLGTMYDNGHGVREDIPEAVRWYRKAAEQGYANAQTNLGLKYSNGHGVKEDDKEAVRWYRKAAEQGYARAQYALGNMYYFGHGVKESNAEAVRWYRKAAEQKYASAESQLGFMYDQGLGVMEDDVEAVRWYRKAAEQGDDTAQNNIGLMYREGLGVKKSVSEAKKWFQKAAAKGNKKAKSNLKKLGSG